jgi:hypothetical protein
VRAITLTGPEQAKCIRHFYAFCSLYLPGVARSHLRVQCCCRRPSPPGRRDYYRQDQHAAVRNCCPVSRKLDRASEPAALSLIHPFRRRRPGKRYARGLRKASSDIWKAYFLTHDVFLLPAVFLPAFVTTIVSPSNSVSYTRNRGTNPMSICLSGFRSRPLQACRPAWRP